MTVDYDAILAELRAEMPDADKAAIRRVFAERIAAATSDDRRERRSRAAKGGSDVRRLNADLIDRGMLKPPDASRSPKGIFDGEKTT